MTKKGIFIIGVLIIFLFISGCDNNKKYVVSEVSCQATAELPVGQNSPGNLLYEGSGTVQLNTTSPNPVPVLIITKLYKDGALIHRETHSNNVPSNGGLLAEQVAISMVHLTDEGPHTVKMEVDWDVQTTMGGRLSGSGLCTDSHDFVVV